MRNSVAAFFILAAIGLAGSAYAQMTLTFAGKNGAGGPPPTCTGVVDLSLGCPQPMLGVF